MQRTETPKITAEQALKLLDQAWAYYTPEPKVQPSQQDEPELFQYANAA